MNMPEQRIVLANSSRLLRDMLKRIIHKSHTLEVVNEITDLRDLPSLNKHTDPEWVIVSLSYDDGVPAWVDGYMAEHPSVRFMAVATDGSKIKMKWLEVREQEWNGPSLDDFIHILENKISPP